MGRTSHQTLFTFCFLLNFPVTYWFLLDSHFFNNYFFLIENKGKMVTTSCLLGKSISSLIRTGLRFLNKLFWRSNVLLF